MQGQGSEYKHYIQIFGIFTNQRRKTIKILENADTREKYWNNYYREKSAPNIPSQFAVFFANEITPDSLVVELGSGNGRDSMFFATQFKYVCGVDGSDTAIASCIANSDEIGFRNIDFIPAMIDETNLSKKIEDKILKASHDAPVYIYSRFFLHSINEQDEDQLIKLMDKLLQNRRGGIFMEFRTEEDETLSKYTGTHFRRYVNPEILIAKFSRLGFKVNYHVEGTGFAKYKTDDAYVARLVFGRL